MLGDRSVYGGGTGPELSWSPGGATSIDVIWDGKSHGKEGNIALADGSVRQFNSKGLRDQISLALQSGSTNVVFSLPQGTE